jgi:cytochrome c-type biogenesis protein
MTTNVSLATALTAGTLSFLSPCVLPLVPPYLVYLTGTSLDELVAGGAATLPSSTTPQRRAIVAAPLFVLGFSTVFIALGASASAIGGLLRSYSGVLATVAGIAIIVMGLHFLGLTRLGFLMREKRLGMARPIGLWGAYAMGVAFAFGWTPCIGPILAAILAIAGAEATVAKGAGLLAVYSLGLGVPFLLAALAIRPFVGFLAHFKTHLRMVEKVMGGLLVLTGIAFLGGFIEQASYWLLEAFPALGRIG